MRAQKTSCIIVHVSWGRELLSVLSKAMGVGTLIQEILESEEVWNEVNKAICCIYNELNELREGENYQAL